MLSTPLILPSTNGNTLFKSLLQFLLHVAHYGNIRSQGASRSPICTFFLLGLENYLTFAVLKVTWKIQNSIGNTTSIFRC